MSANFQTDQAPMPSLVEVEKAVLGACLLDKEACILALELLNPTHLYDDRNKVIFEAMQGLFEANHPIDLLTVAEALHRRGNTKLYVYLSELASMVASSANLEYHCRLLIQAGMRRSLIKLSHETMAKAYDASLDVFDVLEQTEAELFGVSGGLVGNGFTMRELVPQALKQLKELSEKSEGLTGVASGFHALDKLTSGWQASDFVVLAARPGMGKTAFTLAMALNAAKAGIPVGFFSLEMSAQQLVTRLVSMDLEISSETLRQGRLSEADWTLIAAQAEAFSKLPIYINDAAGISLFDLRSKARRLVQKNGIKLLVIDYLQLMTLGDGTKGKGNREQEISTISRSLKGLAKELKIPVLALSQLSREVEKRPNKRPQLSDLRESGAIEQDADIVGFLYRAEYYGIMEDEDGNPLKGIAEVIITKHRNGAAGTVKLGWKGQFAKFENIETLEEDTILDFSPSDDTPF